MEELSYKSSVNSLSGKFSFEVDGFLNLSDEVGETIESPEFELCTRLWQLRIFPGGSLQAHKGYLSFYLASKSIIVTRASYKLIVVRQERLSTDSDEDEPLNVSTSRPDEVFASTGIRKFEARGVHVDGWGRDKFISNAVLRDPSNGFIVNNKIIFRVEITVFGDLDVPFNQKLIISSKKENTMKNDFKRVLFDKSTADLKLIVGEDGNTEAISVHRAFLCARSPVFRAMLESRDDSMIELHEKQVRIPDFDPLTIKDLCAYMYTEECSQDSLKQHADRLLRAAMKYQVLGLVYQAEEFLSTMLSVENACDMLQLADMYDAQNLREFVVEYISTHPQDVIKSEGFGSIKAELQEEVQSITERSMKKCCKRRVDKGAWQCIIV